MTIDFFERFFITVVLVCCSASLGFGVYEMSKQPAVVVVPETQAEQTRRELRDAWEVFCLEAYPAQFCVEESARLFPAALF
jgi:hypothetical protein